MDRPYKLFVEGSDDMHVILHLMSRHGYDWGDAPTRRTDIENSGGYFRLLEASPVAAKSYSRLGFVLDADLHPTARWQSLRDRLLTVNVTLPATPFPHGTIVDGFKPGWRVGAWLMPDNVERGAIEDFLAELISSSDSIWPFAQEATDRAAEIGAPYPPKDGLKCKLHTWLSWQEVPGRPYGTALEARYFQDSSPTAKDFVEWFRNLFERQQ